MEMVDLMGYKGVVKISLSKREYSTLMDIRGAPEDVHFMIYASKTEKGRNVLEGDEEIFDGLLSLISEEIGEGLCPSKNISPYWGFAKSRSQLAGLDRNVIWAIADEDVLKWTKTGHNAQCSRVDKMFLITVV